MHRTLCMAWVACLAFGLALSPRGAFAGYAASEIPEAEQDSEAIDVDDLGRVLILMPNYFCGFSTTVLLPPIEGGQELSLECAECFHVGTRARGLGRDGSIPGESIRFASGECPGVGDAAIWDAQGKDLPLSTIGAVGSVAVDANRSGQIVGGGNNPLPDSNLIDAFAVVWLSGPSPFVRLPADAGQAAGAARINESGVIIGNEQSYADLERTRAVIWTPGPDGYSFAHLGELDGGATSDALALDDGGRVVGASADAAGSDVAVLWRPGPSGYTVERLPVPFQDGWCSQATAINQHGQIAGICSSVEQPPIGVLWQMNGESVNFVDFFDPLPGTSTSAVIAMNDAGLAVGSSGESPSLSTYWRIGVFAAAPAPRCGARVPLHRGSSAAGFPAVSPDPGECSPLVRLPAPSGH